ncbi:MAG: hypothetical protein ABI184_00085 [Ginsengibacter sp.]
MQKILILIIVISSSRCVSAQLANTSWKGNFNIPDPTEMILKFKTDTLLLNYPYGSAIETMSYKINNDTLSIQKLAGQSQCSYSKDATYIIKIKDKKLFISPLSDDCYDRVNSWSSKGLEKIESGNL